MIRTGTVTWRCDFAILAPKTRLWVAHAESVQAHAVHTAVDGCAGVHVYCNTKYEENKRKLFILKALLHTLRMHKQAPHTRSVHNGQLTGAPLSRILLHVHIRHIQSLVGGHLNANSAKVQSTNRPFTVLYLHRTYKNAKATT